MAAALFQQSCTALMEKTRFSIFYHYGGFVAYYDGGRHYIGGKLEPVHGLYSNNFSFSDLREDVAKFGFQFNEYQLMYQIVRQGVKYELFDLKGEATFPEMMKQAVELNGILNIYIVVKKNNNAVFESQSSKLKKAQKKKGVPLQKNKECAGEVLNQLDGVAQQTDLNSAGEVVNQMDGVAQQKNINSASELLIKVDEKIESEYLDYNPVGESDTDDGLSDDNLSNDVEYIEARKNTTKYKKMQPEIVQTMHTVRSVRSTGKVKAIESGAVASCADSVSSEFHSDYYDSDAEVNSDGSDEEECNGKKKKYGVYDPKCDHKLLVLLLGMKFENAHQCKEAVREWAIWNGHNLKIIRSSRYQLEMRCMKNCPWKLYGSMLPDECTFCIKTLVSEHLCPRVLENRMVTGNWIAKQYRNKFRRCPNFSAKELAGDLLETFCVRVSRAMLYRSKSLALEILRGSVIEHYGFLRSYKAELMRVDREGRFDFMLEEGGTFKAFYIGFSSLKKGFMKGCRKIIGFDGCFLKTFLGGALLTAVAKDGNNQMFPICWAVVESENEFFWTWFLEILFEELGIIDGYGWSFISDQQKGLTNAIMKLTPHAEHRNCARHVYCNWKKEFKGQTLKNLFWRAARSTYEASYNAAIEKLLEEDEAAHKDFLKRGPNKFCKFYMSEYPKSDMIDNNVCECFNGYIVKTRGKHIIEMLEEIRCALMERMHKKHTEMTGVTFTICPRIRERVEELKYNSRICTSTPSIGDKFQVAIKDDQYVVNLKTLTCTCRAWQLTGIPCMHACSSILWLNKDPLDFVDPYYSVQMYLEAYRYAIEPLNGKKMWPRAEGNAIKPPVIKPMPGRPKTKRKRGIEEDKNPNKLSKSGVLMSCSRCGVVGHNTRTCKETNIQRRVKTPASRGRPRKPIAPGTSHRQQLPRVVSADDKRTKRREKRRVNEGFGVRIIEETNNMYIRPPGTKPETSRAQLIAAGRNQQSQAQPQKQPAASGGRNARGGRGGRSGMGGRGGRGGRSGMGGRGGRGNEASTVTIQPSYARATTSSRGKVAKYSKKLF